MSSKSSKITTALLLTFLVLPLLSAAAGAPSMPALSVRLLPGTDPSVLNDLVNVRAAKGQGPAALQLDLAHKRVLNGAEQVVTDSDVANPIHLHGIVDKWRYAQALQAIAAAHPQEMRIEPGSHPLRMPAPPVSYNGETDTFIVPDVSAGRQVVVFNLSPIGTLQLLYSPENQPEDAPGGMVAVPATVTSPFGVDHVVAVSAADPAGIRALTAWLAETARADGMLDSKGAFLEQLMALRDVCVGMMATFSCLDAANCKR